MILPNNCFQVTARNFFSYVAFNVTLIFFEINAQQIGVGFFDGVTGTIVLTG